MTLEAGYFVGGHEARARGLIAPPGGATFPLDALAAHPLPIAELAIPAEVNAGRWVARCPFCPGAEAVTPALPILWCDDCQMAELDGQAARVIFPDDLAAIEAELERRPADRRNLSAEDHQLAAVRGTTVLARLRAENIVHGVVSSTAAERILAKATYWGEGLVTAELADLEGLGADFLEQAYRYGDPRPAPPGAIAMLGA